MKPFCIVLAVIASSLWAFPPLAHASQSKPFPDFDESGTVDFPDFLQFVSKFGSEQGDETYESQFDLDSDGVVAFSDFLIFASNFGKKVFRISDLRKDLPLRAVHVAGNWGTNATMVREWEAAGSVGRLIPMEYIQWLKGLHVNWVGLSIGLFYNDSLDSTVERNYTRDDATFSDKALRQMIQEFKAHEFHVYLTLAFEDYYLPDPSRRAERWKLGNPYAPKWWSDSDLLPKNWPWSLDHPDHERFVAEFWETYTQQAVHFARIAEEEGVSMYSLGTETDYLFRTRSGDVWPNHFGKELKTMVERVRCVYSGLLTYDMHTSVFIWPHDYGPGSDHLWEDLDLDVIGLSAYFPITDTAPTSVISVAQVQAKYNEIFDHHLKPLAKRNPTRPILFLEYAAQDDISSPALLGYSHFSQYVFADADGNGLDDGEETQANIYQGLINAMNDNPGLVNGAFFFDNWITTEELWNEWWVHHRSLSIKGKLAEDVIRTTYESYKSKDK